MHPQEMMDTWWNSSWCHFANSLCILCIVVDWRWIGIGRLGGLGWLLPCCHQSSSTCPSWFPDHRQASWIFVTWPWIRWKNRPRIVACFVWTWWGPQVPLLWPRARTRVSCHRCSIDWHFVGASGCLSCFEPRCVLLVVKFDLSIWVNIAQGWSTKSPASQTSICLLCALRSPSTPRCTRLWPSCAWASGRQSPRDQASWVP